MFEVILSPEARVFYDQANPPLARKLARCFVQLEHEPRRHNNIKRLSGKLSGRLRYRIGEWRVLYRIDDRTAQVHVLLIAHRASQRDIRVIFNELHGADALYAACALTNLLSAAA